ncbi:MAG: arginine deiminase family protein [Novosphingobium sp.]
MKLQFDTFTPFATQAVGGPLVANASSETGRLTDVVLCPPHYLAPVPCCAVTRESLASGFALKADRAKQQHAALVRVLRENGVACHMLEPKAGLPDMCFTRDIAVATPFGLRLLNPAMPHRKGEAVALARTCREWGISVDPVDSGTIEGGDVCVARPGLLLVGTSGERTVPAAVESFAAPFRAAGWNVLVCPFHADHLHLDTIFCMVSPYEAIACIDLLDRDFVTQVEAQGIRILPVSPQMAATLGCNILSLGERHIIASEGSTEVITLLRDAGYRVTEVDVSEFTACGGGIHCLTMPLCRKG